MAGESHLPEKTQRRLLKKELGKHYFHKYGIWYYFNAGSITNCECFNRGHSVVVCKLSTKSEAVNTNTYHKNATFLYVNIHLFL
jgi:hypothetical protein